MSATDVGQNDNDYSDTSPSVMILHVLTSTGALLLSALLAWLLNMLALRPWRRAAQAHWTERARLLYPVQKAARLNFILIPAFMVIAQLALPAAWQTHGSACAGAAFFGTLAGTYPVDHALFPSLRLVEWAGLAAWGWLLRLAMIGIGLCLVWYMPEEIGWRAAGFGALAAALLLALNCGLTIRIGRILGLTRLASERLARLVSETSVRMKIRVSRVWLVKSPTANAWAFVMTREIMFSTGLQDNLTDEEIRAICCHEMGHLSESKAAKLCRVAAAYAFLPLVFIQPLTHAAGPFGLLAACGFLLVVTLVANRFRRRLEIRADQAGKSHEVAAGGYAQALEHIYQLNHMPAVMSGKRTIHPHLYDRLLAAGVTPSYPRPKAPSKVGLQTFAVCGLIVGAGVLALMLRG